MLDDKAFIEIKELATDIPAMAFESDGEFFYIGLGKKDGNETINSRILKVKVDGIC